MKPLFVFFGKNRKLGDALVFFSCLAPGYGIAKSLSRLEPLVITNKFTRVVGRACGQKCIDFSNNISLLLFGIFLRLYCMLSSRDLVLVNLTGHSTSFSLLIRSAGPSTWYSREKNFAFCSDGRRLNFSHTSQFEYCGGPLSLVFNLYQTPSRILSIAQNCQREGLIAIFPNAAERRKSLTTGALKLILDRISGYGPEKIVIAFNSKDKSPKITGKAIASDFPQFRPANVNSLTKLIGLLERVDSVITVDTGIYVLCCAMGIPCVIYFGPTQPAKSSYLSGERQPLVTSVRFLPLENRHCEAFNCVDAVCIESALTGTLQPERVGTTPAQCLLRTIGSLP